MCKTKDAVKSSLHIPAGLFLICLFRGLHIQYIIVVFFLPDAEVETEIDAKPTCVALPETTGIHRALPDGEIILIGPENIIHAECNSQLLFKKPSVDTAVQCTKAGKLIELLLSFQSKEPIECKCGFFIEL